MTKKRLYLILTLGLIAGYSWLAYNLSQQHALNSKPVCFFKRTTGIPCPSCGNTRSVLAITSGDFYNAVLINPLGYVITAILIIFPFWILYDVILRKETLYRGYLQFEKALSKKTVAILLILLILLNWIWNIQKGL